LVSSVLQKLVGYNKKSNFKKLKKKQKLKKSSDKLKKPAKNSSVNWKTARFFIFSSKISKINFFTKNRSVFWFYVFLVKPVGAILGVQIVFKSLRKERIQQVINT
jgi:hypothetical protein